VFVDASAAVAMILEEPDWEIHRNKLKSSRRRYMSAIADYETAIAVRRNKQIGTAEAYAILTQFQRIFGIQNIGISDKHSEVALSAFEQYGKGQGHKAGLNMGDCFSYACARIQKVSLLCKGDDFIHTDIRNA
jgi:ribonuclease VapC